MIITNSLNKGIKCQFADFSVVFDPQKDISANVVLRTSFKAPIDEGVYGEIIGAGEYEIEGNKIIGIELMTESTPEMIKTAYMVTLEGIKLCYLGNLTKDLDEAALDKISQVDILFIPAPNQEFDSKKIASLIKQIEPKMIIPFDDSDIQSVTKELGQKPETTDKVTIKKKDLEELNAKLVHLGVSK